MTTATLNLEQWIERSQQALERARQAEAARFEAQKEELRQRVEEALRQWLGEWAFLLEQATPNFYWRKGWGGEPELESAKWHISFPPETKLAPVVIRQNSRGFTAIVGGHTLDAPAYILAKAREAWPEWIKEQRRKRLEDWGKKIEKASNVGCSTGCSPEAYAEALQALEALWQEVPEDLRANLGWKYDQQKAILTRRLEEAREREERERQARQIAEAFVAWYREKVEPFAQRLQALKEKWENTPFTVYEVTYGVVAMDEEGIVFADTRSFFSLSPQPDDEGYWHTLDGRRVRVPHLASVEEKTVTPREVPWEVETALPRLTIPHMAPESPWATRIVLPPTVSKEALAELRQTYVPPRCPDFDLPRQLWFDKARELLEDEA